MNRTYDSAAAFKDLPYALYESAWKFSQSLGTKAMAMLPKQMDDVHRRAFLLGALAALGSLEASAQTTTSPAPQQGNIADLQDPFNSVGRFLCQVSGWLRGPIGVGLVLTAIVIAGISLAVGGRRSTSILVSALIGAVVILGARAILQLVIGAQTSICPTGNTPTNP